MKNLEEKIAKIASSIVGGSMILSFLIAFIFLGLALFSTDELKHLLNPFVLKWLGITVLYIFSIYLIATLPGKSEKRRLFSWTFSIIYHAFLLLYLWQLFDKEDVAFLLGMVECAVLALSIIGVCSFYYEKQKINNV